MPPRLNKRQQRELEELEALKSTSTEQISDDDAEPGPSHHRGGFGNLFAAESSSDEEEVTKTKKSKKKKKKKAADAPAPEVVSPKEPVKPIRSTPSIANPRNDKKAQKKAKAKEKKAANDELDKALEELSLQYPPSQKISQSAPGRLSLADLLSVSLQHLDADGEMRKFFGSKVVQANKAESSNHKKTPTVRSNLTRPQSTWWAAKGREGLSLRPLSDEETKEKFNRHSWSSMQEKWWTVEYSKRYKSMTKVFMATVLSGDPQGFWDLLRTSPWHADTLLQISEVYRHREEHAQAVDFIDRALFTYERAFIGAFNFTSGLNRLDFDYVENRPFFLAIHRQVADLQRRGCVRTSFEFARLMYALDPWSDPHGSLFHLDYLSLKAGMHQWLLDVYDIFLERRGQLSKDDRRLDPTLLPGWSYARALALRVKEGAAGSSDRSISTEALKEAVMDFPSVVPLLADKLDATLPIALRAHRDFRIETDAASLSVPMGVLHLLSHLYVQRSSPLWKEHSAWFSTTITDAFGAKPSSLPATDRRKAFIGQFEDQTRCYSVYRHVMVLESSYRRLFSFIPKQVLAAKSLACDPLPPPTALTEYDNTFFQNVEDFYSPRLSNRRQRVVNEAMLAQLMPDPAFRQQLQGFFEAHPNLAARFPGGFMQFVQMIRQLPPDALEDLMMAEAMNEPGVMPGGLGNMQEDLEGDVDVEFGNIALGVAGLQMGPADQVVEDDLFEEGEVSEEEDEEEEVSPLPRVIRNILGRFWGRAAPADDTSSEEEAPADDMGVD